MADKQISELVAWSTTSEAKELPGFGFNLTNVRLPSSSVSNTVGATEEPDWDQYWFSVSTAV